ncbi:ribose 1,5-bisphosphokinase [Sodalis endosymbiont of Spalangia cameroni]|uniref:ribose 1,5-bisphosphokinase n=1 Tax=Sodalis praecaptivus TaxID=1239307 RepID=UPI0031FA367E
MARLIWLMGASGAGKDTLLQVLRASAPPGLLVAHRYITRAADAGGENHIALSEAEFHRRQEAGLFAIHWQAHRQHYALGIEIDLWLDRGQDVVVNGSRLHLPALTPRYAGRLLPVCLTVSQPVLAQRLRQRGREDETAINARLARADTSIPPGCYQINNDGPLDDTLTAFHYVLEQSRCN